ncbi:serine/threonine protein kinase TNNI3K, putative [Entamoeba invadens IP1]|uniref:Serine/threonine protein kinase TNNI3K, putative n=1 Tax=Entamoeba invadens IP1 TaxID=370355 RepID=A0A0A1TVX7_ENTIV|nr:serine/threonine protein kinase TNNI3K, putative [Entamoeba invadens IP1]ELP84601.1 serine/threonine protein kinase TNNI3K, putative [Entamoeba invadens IP1]|eukprot:XP_004183947.1 serine/threonine protein kinase TNNI3K, putative [Entamoeba invadens IP1]
MSEKVGETRKEARLSFSEKKQLNRIIRAEFNYAEDLFPVPMTTGESYFSISVGDKTNKVHVSRKTTSIYFRQPINTVEFRNVSTSIKEIVIEFHDHEKKKTPDIWTTRMQINQLLPFNTVHTKTFQLEKMCDLIQPIIRAQTAPATPNISGNVLSGSSEIPLNESFDVEARIKSTLMNKVPSKSSSTHLSEMMEITPRDTLVGEKVEPPIMHADKIIQSKPRPTVTVTLYLFPEVNPKQEKMTKFPLHAAVLDTDLRKVLTLLESGKVDVNAQDEQGNTALHVATLVSYNEHILVSLLKNAPTIDVNKKNYDGNTPFHFFCLNFSNPNYSAAMDLFFRLGADIEATNKNMETVLYSAVRNKSIRMLLVTRLLEKGANVNATTLRQSTALHYAVYNERTDLLSVLLEHKANLHIKDSKGLTPYAIAMEKSERYAQTVRDFNDLVEYLHSISASDEAVALLVKNKMFKHKLRGMSARSLEKIGITSAEGKVLAAKFKTLPNVEAKEDKSENEETERGKLLALIENGKTIIDQSEIEFLQNIGSGASGVVYTAAYKGYIVAVKTLKATNMKEVKEFQQESEVLNRLQHKNVVKFYGIIVDKQFAMVMEYCSQGSLYDLLVKPETAMTWEKVLDFSEQLALGMEYLHSQNPPVLHRDLKTLNVLVSIEKDKETGKECEVLKICDFGLSRFDSEFITSTKDRGTYAYCAPEVYYNQRYTTQSDVYSYGIILWELVYRLIYQKYQRPFQEFPELTMDVQIIIQSATSDLRPTIPPSTPQKMATLIRQCVLREQDNRPKALDIVNTLAQMRKDFKSRPQLWNESIMQN